MNIDRREHETSYRSDKGAHIAFVYANKSHWYAADANGEDLPKGWRLPNREAAERVALEWAEGQTTMEGME